jgi:hypothetical protein
MRWAAEWKSNWCGEEGRRQGRKFTVESSKLTIKEKDNAEARRICRERKSAVDFPAVADAKDKNQQAVVFDFADEPIVADAVFPKFTEF